MSVILAQEPQLPNKDYETTNGVNTADADPNHTEGTEGHGRALTSAQPD